MGQVKRFFILLVIISIVAIQHQLLGQSIVSNNEYTADIQHFNIDNGLAGRFANYTFKDSRGLIWIGTQQGLQRFDGQNFTTFDEDTGLPFNQVMEITEDEMGYLWLYRNCHGKSPDYCSKAVAFLHTISHEVVTFEERFGENAPFKPSEINRIITHPNDKTLFILTDKVTYTWTISNGFKAFPANQFDAAPKIFQAFNNGNIAAYHQSEIAFLAYLMDKEGNVLSEQQLSTTELHAETFGAFPFSIFPNLLMSDLPEQGHKKTYFSMDENGIVKEVEHTMPKDLDIPKIKRHVFFDEALNTYWVATRKGVTQVVLKKNFFKYLDDGISPQLHWFIQPRSSGNFLFSKGSNILITYNSTTQTIVAINDKESNWIENISQNQLKETFANASHFYANQRDLLVEENQRLKQIEIAKIFDSKVEKVNSVIRIKNAIWFGTPNGLWIYDIENGSCNKFSKVNDFADFSTAFIHAILPIDASTFWITTDDGIYKLSSTKGVIAHYGKNKKGKYFLPLTSSYHLSIANDKTIWLADRKGLIHWSGEDNQSFKNGQHYQHYTKKNGLPDNICLAVYEDDYGSVWVSTLKGLVQIKTKTNQMKVHNKKNGLHLNYFMEYGHYQAPSGELFFAAYGGLVHFDPKDFKNQHFDEPDIPLSIVDFEQYNQSTQQFERNTLNLLKNNLIQLTPNGNLFNITVALTDYRGADEHQFAYKIPGYQEDWQLISSNKIRISGLPYGQQTLMIKGRLSDGRYSSNILSIRVQVLRPLYLRWWFIVLTLVTLIGLVYFYNQRRLHNYQKRQNELKALVQERTEQIEEDKTIITQQAEELRALDQVKSRFFANVSHELRTPLTLMLSPLKSVLQRNELNNRDYTYLSVAERNGKRLLRLVNEILELTKLESGKMEAQYSTMLLYSFLKTIVASFESHAETQQIELTFEYQLPNHLQIKLDTKKTEIIIINLLSNTLKYTPTGGTVTLVANGNTDKLQIAVTDTGRGIHPEDLPHIFNRFYQSNQKDGTAEGGTGIGLALSQEFAKLMNGTLTVKSQLSKGSTFTLNLPKIEVIKSLSDENYQLLQENETEAKEEKAKALLNFESLVKLDEPTELAKPTILIVEDNPDLQTFIKSLLEEKYNIVTANNGKEALEQLRVASSELRVDQKNTNNQPTSNGQPVIRNPQLILSDIMMPIMDGYQLLETLKSSDDYRHIPVIMLTARAAQDDKLKALRIGVDDYLLKPFDEEELLVRIENLLLNTSNRLPLVQEENLKNGKATNHGETEVASTPEIMFTTEDIAWLVDLEQATIKELHQFYFGVEQLARSMYCSRQQLNRRVKQLTGLTASTYIKEARLNQAKFLLENKNCNSVKVVAIEVGFKDIKYFARQFKARFGKLPSDYFE
jgi:signal transduction histidine kinase/CheY-like chemotaxis protein/AraC-like DNA-binding protein